MSSLTPGAITARRSAIDRLAGGIVTGAMDELAADLRERPASLERTLFLNSWASRRVPAPTLIQMLAAALLEDGDLDGALGAIEHVAGSAEGARTLLMTHHVDLAAFCKSSGFPSKIANGYEIEDVNSIDQVHPKQDLSSICGLPSGLVIGESFGPASSSGFVFWNRTVFNPNRAVRHDAFELLPPLMVASSARCIARINDVKTYGPAVLIGDSSNFGHWLLNHAARLALIDNQPDLKALPLVVGNNAPGFVLETIELLGRDPNHLIRITPGELARFEMLWIPDMPFCGKLGDRKIYISRRALSWIRDAMGTRKRKTANRRIFVSRANAKRRRIVNEPEILQRLEPLGFEIVDPAGMPVRIQAELASEAACIVGGFGAGMAISYLASPATRVIEISHPTPSMRIHKATCKILGQQYVCVDSQPATDGPHDANGDVFVDPASVFAAVQSSLSITA